MDTKYINDKINEIFEKEEFKNLPKQVTDDLFKMMSGFEFNDNDDLRLLLSRIHQQFIAQFNFAWCRKQFEAMNDDMKHNDACL